MSNPPKKWLSDMSWISLDGRWAKEEPNGLCFTGSEYDPPTAQGPSRGPPDIVDKWILFGTTLFDQHFREGSISAQVEFDEIDHRSSAEILLQYDTTTKDMLTFGVTGGGLKITPNVAGYMYKLRHWGPPLDQQSERQGQNTGASGKAWTTLFELGVGSNLQAKRPYNIEVNVRGSLITLFVDRVEIGKHNLRIPSLPGYPCGLFCGSHSKIHFREIALEAVTPKAFVVMEFATREYEALFRDVIAPVCEAEGLQPYRADFTYMPGLVIEDIKKQIAEARVHNSRNYACQPECLL